MLARTFTACAVAVVLFSSPAAADQPTLASARELYASAEYGDALTMLDSLAGLSQSREEQRSIGLYRALCLVALGRAADADKAIETMISSDPLYRPTGEDIPPRMRTALGDARRRMLPTIIQQRYAEAKIAFDKERFDEAAASFKQVLDSLADPDVAAAASQPPLADLKTLAVGFHQLSARMAAPPPAPVTVAPEPVAFVPPPPRIYDQNDYGVIAPIIIRQALPPYQGKVTSAGMAMIEVVIDERGQVETATMRVPLNANFDKHALSAAKAWTYQPAILEGVPVKFRKRVQVSVVPPAVRNPMGIR
jgi:TonB family protein